MILAAERKQKYPNARLMTDVSLAIARLVYVHHRAGGNGYDLEQSIEEIADSVLNREAPNGS